MQWSPSFPNPNPIENVWFWLKHNVREMIKDSVAHAHPTEGSIEMVKEEWKKLGWDTVDGMVDRMPKRIKALLKAKGGSTEH
jgi:hypothetical protein